MKRCLALFLLFTACRYEPPAGNVEPGSHQQEIETWRANRASRLRAPDGWLALAGLYWLNEGNNDVSLPSKPPVPAQFVLANGKVTLAANSALTIEGKPVTAATELQNDTEATPTVVRSGTLSFVAIRREDALHGPRFGVRVRDTATDARAHFLGLEYFPTDTSYRVVARFEPYNPPKKILITNVLGMTSNEISPGALVFTLQGQEFRIDPILEQGEKDYFIIFKDGTSGNETYGAARYLYAHPPDASGKTIVDFNKAYNPPCAFTPYATCPLPPPQNRLPIRIEAGEKKYAGGHA
ncbi:MAG: uncharacterized protein QOK37_4159 [Thermoanaerobaculia bacterium]|jgi:uncharacterized protein (DUF1684 family)|nr:uncharacterized protein [Thermoanaerobaculia bacterium]